MTSDITAIPQSAAPVASKKRLLSLDVMRGLTVAFMVIVNNGAGPESYLHLNHSEWNGITLCDLVFPFFLFIMGITTYLSLSKRNFAPSGATIRKIVKRTLIILIIGWAIHWFSNVCHGKGLLDFGHLRLTGVLTRIALCYGVVSLLSLALSRKAMAWTTAALLIIYGAILLLFNGYENGPANVNAIVDHALLPDGLLYTKRPVDPEGILGTVPAIAHTIIGFCCGAILASREPLDRRLLRLFVCAALLIAGGFLLSGILPANKRIWSPSYVLITCGLAAALLATISWFVDERGMRRGLGFFESFGVNPLFLYVVADILGIIFGSFGVSKAIYASLFAAIGNPQLASAIYAIGLMLLTGLIGLPLYLKKIYIKI